MGFKTEETLHHSNMVIKVQWLNDDAPGCDALG